MKEQQTCHPQHEEMLQRIEKLEKHYHNLPEPYNTDGPTSPPCGLFLRESAKPLQGETEATEMQTMAVHLAVLAQRDKAYEALRHIARILGRVE